MAKVFGPLGRLLDRLKYGHIPKLSSNTLKKNLPFCVYCITCKIFEAFQEICISNRFSSGFLKHRNENHRCALLQVTTSAPTDQGSTVLLVEQRKAPPKARGDFEGENAETFS